MFAGRGQVDREADAPDARGPRVQGVGERAEVDVDRAPAHDGTVHQSRADDPRSGDAADRRREQREGHLAREGECARKAVRGPGVCAPLVGGVRIGGIGGLIDGRAGRAMTFHREARRTLRRGRSTSGGAASMSGRRAARRPSGRAAGRSPSSRRRMCSLAAALVCAVLWVAWPAVTGLPGRIAAARVVQVEVLGADRRAGGTGGPGGPRRQGVRVGYHLGHPDRRARRHRPVRGDRDRDGEPLRVLRSVAESDRAGLVAPGDVPVDVAADRRARRYRP